MAYVVIIFVVICVANGHQYFEAQELKPCPKPLPYADLQLDQLNGNWQVSLIILDAATEDLEESEVCINGHISVKNSTFMKQTWDMYSPKLPEDPVGSIELAVTVVRPGIWLVQTPLGEKLSATVFGYDLECVMVAHCGWQKGKLVHLWTAGITRENKLSSKLRVKLSSLLLDNGYDPATTKIIVWNHC